MTKADLMPTSSLFHTGHYNILAAQLRENFTVADERETSPSYHASVVNENGRVCSIALGLAKRLQEDNPAFDPLKFLDACSPNPDLYPLSELWESYSER